MSRIYLIFLFLVLTFTGWSQPDASRFVPDPAREEMFAPYLAVRHGGPQGLALFKKEHPALYYQELWYFCKSFYVKRNVRSEGASIVENQIDISRFESQRKNVETAADLKGYRDDLILLAEKDLLYKPDYLK